MSIFKRYISLLLVMLILVGVFAPAAQAAPAEETATVNADGVTVEGTNGFGNLLSQEITESQAEAEEEASEYSGGYTVTDLEIEDGVATVTYDSMEEATLVVALYTEDGMRMVNSAKTTVTPDATEVTVAFEGEMPEYFLASAYIVDGYDLSPLCTAYDTPMYTREMQELLASTVNDYDPEKVLNLDEDETTNFAVYADSTIVIVPTEGFNTVVSIDDENMTYVIKNADEQMLSLQGGDIFAYAYDDNELLIVKVGSIEVNDTTVTIIGAELDMSEAFEAVKVDGIGDNENIVVDDSTAGEGISYVGLVEDDGVINPNSVEGGDTTTLKHKFEIKIKSKADDGHTSASLAVSGSLDLALDVSVKYYISTSQKYVEFKLSPHLTFSLGVQESLVLSEELGYLAVSPVPGVYVGFEPELQLKLDCKTDFKASLKSVIGFQYDTSSGVQNISKKPELDVGIDVEGTIFLGVDFCPQVAIVSDKLSEIEVNMLVGFELESKASGKAFEAYKKDADEYHECQECIAMDIRVKAKIGGTLKFLDQDWLSVSITIGEWTHKLGEMYYSLDKNEFGIGKCPNKLFRVTVQVKDKEYNPIPGETVTVSTFDEALTTDENGLVVFYTPEDEIVVRAEKDGYFSAERVKINRAWKIVLCLVYQVASGDNGGSSGSSEPGNPFDGIDFGGVEGDDFIDNFAVVASGECGADLSWALYSNGLLIISGSGRMHDFLTNSHLPIPAPWHTNRSQIKSVHIEDGVTSIGRYAFNDCEHMTSVTIPDSVTSIEHGAFSGCKSLTSVAIPDSVTFIGRYAFGYCHSLTSVTIPNSITSISHDTFSDCDNLTSVVIGNSVTFIGDYAFGYCHSLTSVTLPNSVISIGNSTFCFCDSLTSITVPNSVTSIDHKAFAYCYNLTRVFWGGDAPTFGSNVFYNVTATAYYPADNPTWTSEVMQNYGGTITWVPYTPVEGSSIIGELTEISAQRPTVEIKAVYGGEYDTEITEESTIKTASFKDLIPSEQYVLLAMASIEVEEPLASDNLLFIDQAAALEDGTLVFQYIQRTPCDISYVVACGASHKNLKDAEVSFPEMVADGELQVVDPVVVYDGETLTEGRDYVIVGKVDFTEAGEYTCYIRGIHNYTGLVECIYRVTEKVTENPFTDVMPGSYFYEPVLWALKNGITSGTSATTFSPDSQCVRSQVVTFLWRAAGSPEPTRTDNPFVDVKSTDYYYKPVLWALENGITSGVDATHFGAAVNCSREQVVTFLYQAKGRPAINGTANPFTDVVKGSYYEKPVLWALENGITSGMGDGTFGVSVTCTRAQIVTFLYKAFVNK